MSIPLTFFYCTAARPDNYNLKLIKYSILFSAVQVKEMKCLKQSPAYKQYYEMVP